MFADWGFKFIEDNVLMTANLARNVQKSSATDFMQSSRLIDQDSTDDVNPSMIKVWWFGYRGGWLGLGL